VVPNDVDKFITQLGLNESATKMIKANSVLVALTGATCANIGYLTFNSTANQSVVAIENDESLNSKYLFYYLLSQREQILIEKTGGAQSGINEGDVKNIVVCFPPKKVQISIANYLDEKTTQLDTLVTNKKKLIELLKEERTAIINEAVSGEGKNWERKKLKYLTEIISKGTTPSTVGAEMLLEGEVRFLKAENILSSNSISVYPENFIDSVTNEILKRSELKENDILIVIAGATIGKLAILSENFLPANTNQAISFIRLKNNNLTNWVWLFLQSNSIKENIFLEAVQSAQPNLSMEKLGNFVILVPKEKERKEVEVHIKTETKKIEITISKIEKEIELLQEYRTALISEIVTGKIKVA
jgi:type I restriction enzyme, S subunit